VIGPVPGLSNVYLAAGHEGGGLSMVSFHTPSIFIIKSTNRRTFMIYVVCLDSKCTLF
jgi:hypothetical protein